MLSTEIDFLSGGGELGARMRAMDWGSTSLGPPAAWPRSLKTAVRILLTSRQPMWLGWGPDLIYLYNDPYKSIIGGKHPGALGRPTSEVWREIWDAVGPRIARVMENNEGTYDEALLLLMERHGYREETYYTFSYSPVPDDDGGIGGLICANTDDTQRVLRERQLALLARLSADTMTARTLVEACSLSAKSLATDRYDFPFAGIYLADPAQQRMLLTATAGIEPGHPAMPESVPLDDSSIWPFAQAMRDGGTVYVETLPQFPVPLPVGGWDAPPHHGVAVPITALGRAGSAGVLVAGLSPVRLFDASYRESVDLVASQIAASIASAQAYEDEARRAEALAEIDRAKTAFFSNVSHEFRTPLTLMLGPIEDALAQPDHGLAGESLETTYRNALRLLKLVNSLLDFSRIEAGRVQSSFEPVDLPAFTAELASVFRAAIERAGLRFTVTGEPLPQPVFVDAEMWETIVLNLISNAFKFTFDGEIAVTVRATEKGAELSVRDSGVGIQAEELPRLFERFHRIETANARTYEGSGIGLALVQELVRIHGGEIRVDSTPGSGTTFIVTLPFGSAHLPPEHVGVQQETKRRGTRRAAFAAEADRWLTGDESPAAETMAETMMETPAGHARLLVVDDNADMRDYLARLLRGHWTVDTVRNGHAALAALRESAFDLVLTDVMMPELDGFGLLQAIRKDRELAGTPVIMLSGRAGEESRVEGLAAGADDYIVKPFSARELIARVTTHLQIGRLRREAELRREEAEEANRAKDEFLAMLGHELRTPLTSILGWSRMLRLGLIEEPEAQDEAVEAIERAAKTQTQLIEDLLDVSRIVNGKLRLEVQPVDLTDVIHAAVSAVKPAANANQIRLQVTLDPLAGPVAGDPDRLQQIAWNLLSNAVKFTPRNGRVQVRLERVSSCAELVVTDTGKGIPPAFLPHVFERFRQAEATTTRAHGGLGLGLSIVRSLVELHGGTVEAQSPGEGQGATFIVRLPLMAVHGDTPRTTITLPPRLQPRPEPEVTFECPPELSGCRVLIVDDDAETRRLLTSIVERCQASVTVVSSAKEALRVVGEVRPDVVVSDIEMPSEDGYSLIQQLRARGHHTPAAALTAHARTEDQMRALRAGFDMHIAKPVEPGELVTVIASLLRRGGR